jgi:hypothetical protein
MGDIWISSLHVQGGNLADVFKTNNCNVIVVGPSYRLVTPTAMRLDE